MARRKNSKKTTRKAKMSIQAAADYKAFYAKANSDKRGLFTNKYNW